jgi:hypothetical protein
MITKMVWMEKETMRMERRREGPGLGSDQQGRRWKALKKRVPRQKAAMEVRDLR